MTPKRNTAWILVGLLWLLFLGLILPIYTLYPDSVLDFQYYYRGIQRIRSETPLYDNLQTEDYVGPPLQIQLMTPLITLAPDKTTAELLWFVLNTVVLLSTLLLLSRQLSQRRHRLLLWAVTPLFAPTFVSFWFGQITIVLFALTAGAWLAYKAGKPALTGVLLALAVWTKFYPGLFLLYFLWKRDWRVVISGAITTVLAILVQMIFSGADTFTSYLLNVLPGLTAEGQPYLNYSNNAILGFAQKMFSESPQVIPLASNPALVLVTRLGLMATLFGLTLILISRPVTLSRTRSDQFDLEYAAVLLLALLTGSTLHLHGMLSALLAFVILFRRDYGLPATTRKQLKFLSLLAALLINVHLLISVGYLQRSPNNALPAPALALPFFGMMLLWGMVCYALYRQRQADTAFTPVAQAAAAD